MSNLPAPALRWSECTDEDDDAQPEQEVVMPRPVNPVPAQLEQLDVVECVVPEFDGEWRVQGRKRDVAKKEATQGELLLFACLPFDKRLLYRGVVKGQAGLLSAVEYKGFTRFHGYDPVNRRLVWRRKRDDLAMGVEKASPQYIQRVQTEFAQQVQEVLARASSK